MTADTHSLDSFRSLEGLTVTASEQIFLAQYKQTIPLSHSKGRQIPPPHLTMETSAEFCLQSGTGGFQACLMQFDWVGPRLTRSYKGMGTRVEK